MAGAAPSCAPYPRARLLSGRPTFPIRCSRLATAAVRQAFFC